MAITSRDQLIAALAGPYGWTGGFQKTASLSGTRPMSSWTHLSPFTLSNTAPTTTAVACDADTPGAIAVPRVQQSGKSLYLAALSATSASVTTWMLYDRVAHVGGLVGNTLATQPITGLATPARCTSSVGVQAYLELYTSVGTGPNFAIFLKYTNTAGVANRTGVIAPGFTGWLNNMMIPFQLAAGDLGVASVQSLQFGNTSTAAGNVGVTLARPLHTLPANTAQQSNRRNYLTMPDLTTSPCLFFGYIGATSTIAGTISTVEA
ncbi:MAG: hypothetical protein ABWY93_18840 [Mycobacterium sp.]